ncbi:MAG: hypothetical protein GC150_08565 [Rhizobiales bacterium]|nr:hypothetical protein [Hyphomicrobiales bacterium]
MPETVEKAEVAAGRMVKFLPFVRAFAILATLALAGVFMAEPLGIELPDWATTVALVVWGVAVVDVALLTGIAVLMQGKE